MSKANNISVLEQFIVSSITQADSTETGDYKTANSSYKKIEKVVEFLRESDQLHVLRDLLSHSAVGVRLWAASYLLSLYEEEAISTLQAITNQPGIHSLTAETTLNEWNKGNLKYR